MKNPFTKRPRSEFGGFDDSYDSDFFTATDREDGVLEDEDAAPTPIETPAQPAAKKSAGTVGANLVKVVKPHDYQDGPAIADLLIEGYTVVMNIEALERAATLRLIDFVLGALHVLGGELRRVTKTTLILSPRTGELIGDDAAEEEIL